MNAVVVKIHPFILSQTIYIYKNNLCIHSIKCKQKELSSLCVSLCKQYNLHTIQLNGGGARFLSGIKNQIAQANFDNFDIDIKIN